MPKSKDAASTEWANSEVERRRSPRRQLPFGRTAVLEVGGRAHVVALIDLSATGAYLATRTTIPRDRSLRLKVRLPRIGEVALPCEFVRENGDDAVSGRRGGVGVRFIDLDEPTVSQLEAFVAARGSHFGD